jgi:hypothetical protein
MLPKTTTTTTTAAITTNTLIPNTKQVRTPQIVHLNHLLN